MSGVVQGDGLGKRVAGQGALLALGFGAVQAFSFLRNALVGHWLSRGDFGVAASITLTLQTIEILTDLGADRLIVQAEDGEEPRLMATLHTVCIVRGIVTALLLVAMAMPMAAFFRVPEAWPAFAAAALAPLAKGFVDLDFRRAQRRLANGAYLAVEAGSQVAAFVATVPALMLEPDYHAVVHVSILQGVLMAAASHLLARRRYEIGVDRAHWQRIAAFGWPIWMSAIPLVAVYQGDRALVGRMLGVEVLAGYSAAFMVAMVPGLIAAKVGNAIMLPLLSAVASRAEEMQRRFRAMTAITLLCAAGYLVGAISAGEVLLPLAFGPHYTGLGALMGWLGAMWALRMMQAVPGMALMAIGQTRPFLVAGIVRATGLAGAFGVLLAGGGIEAVAAAGTLAELASLIVMAWQLSAARSGMAGGFLARTAMLVPVAATAVAARDWLGAVYVSPAFTIMTACGLAATLVAALAVADPAMRGLIARSVRRGRMDPAPVG